MPNHVRNYLNVTGDNDLVKQFFNQCKSDESLLDFNQFVKMPDNVFREDLSSEDKIKYPGELNWYDWCNKYWGTKWNAYNVEIIDSMILFNTAWSVPVPVLKAMSEQYPTLTFTNEWIEETTESAGTYQLLNSKVIESEYENWQFWNNGYSGLIHNLNVKYNCKYYIEYLEEMLRDDPTRVELQYYLDKIKVSDND